MKKLFATIFIGFLGAHSALSALCYELNLSYDYFRGIPDGSWNGNSGAFLAANTSAELCDIFEIQLGGSYGFYNWDGRQNQVFRNPKTLERQGFVTAGASTSMCDFNAGIAYDCQFVKHFGIYDLSFHVDQLRLQGGYQFCSEEVGVWGTVRLSKSSKTALGIPVNFKAVNQVNLFWSHYFDNCSIATIWLGSPYGNSLRHGSNRAGDFTAGFELRAPLTENLFADAHGAYMRAKHAHGDHQSRNYAANICVGLTYLFGDCCSRARTSYMSIGNNSNFFIDSNINE